MYRNGDFTIRPANSLQQLIGGALYLPAARPGRLDSQTGARFQDAAGNESVRIRVNTARPIVNGMVIQHAVPYTFQSLRIQGHRQFQTFSRIPSAQSVIQKIIQRQLLVFQAAASIEKQTALRTGRILGTRRRRRKNVRTRRSRSRPPRGSGTAAQYKRREQHRQQPDGCGASCHKQKQLLFPPPSYIIEV